MAILQIESIKTFAKQVVAEAASCNLGDKMTAANAKLTNLRTREDMLRALDCQARSTFGAANVQRQPRPRQ